jgi:hypothetical protein
MRHPPTWKLYAGLWLAMMALRQDFWWWHDVVRGGVAVPEPKAWVSYQVGGASTEVWGAGVLGAAIMTCVMASNSQIPALAAEDEVGTFELVIWKTHELSERRSP